MAKGKRPGGVSGGRRNRKNSDDKVQNDGKLFFQLQNDMAACPSYLGTTLVYIQTDPIVMCVISCRSNLNPAGSMDYI